MWMQTLAQSFDLNTLFRPEIAVPLGGCLVAIVAIVGGLWSKTVKSNRIAELKRAMIERGMSADEIERVIAADEIPEHKRKPPTHSSDRTA